MTGRLQRASLASARRRATAAAISSLGVAALLCSCAGLGDLSLGDSKLREWSEGRTIHGIGVRITARDSDSTRAHAAIEQAFATADEVGAKLLVSREGSEIDILMRVPPGVWIEVSPTTAAALHEVYEIAEATDGAYDPTWPALRKPWGLDAGGSPHVPRQFEIDMALRRVDWEDLEFDEEDDPRARRLTRRTRIDLGGLAIGRLLDAALAELQAAGVPAAHVQSPFEHAVYGGSRPSPWQLELRVRSPEPGGEPSSVGFATLEQGGLAIESVGPITRAPDGTAIHDHFDPRTGYPSQGAHWVALAAPSAGAAAAWADAILAMPPTEARELLKENPTLSAAIADDDKGFWHSDTLTIRLNE